MQYTSYGIRGPRVSRLGFGVMRLPPRRKGLWGSVNFARSVPILRRALEAGVTFFDSHHDYHGGLSEVAIGRALKGWKGPRPVIQTKTPAYREEPLDWFKRRLGEALEKCGVDALDFLLFHSMTHDTFRKRGRLFFRLTDWALKRGMIRARGFSSHDTPERVRGFIDTGEFSAMLLSYNWLNPQMADVIAYGAEQGMGVSIMNPVGGGSLAQDTPQVRALLPGAHSPAEAALRYVLATPGVCVALSGMNSVAQVEENARIASARTPLTSAQFRTMRRRVARIQRQAARFCTQCGYCMPCPHGVDIPQNFLHYNRMKFFGLTEGAQRGFKSLRTHADGDKSALACRRCGACMPKCPNGVPIIEQLALTAKALAE